MAGVRVCVPLLAVALVFAGSVRGGKDRPSLVGAPLDIANADNDEGLQRALQFAMREYNRASNDMYSSRVVRVISAKRQVGAGWACERRRQSGHWAWGERRDRPYQPLGNSWK